MNEKNVKTGKTVIAMRSETPSDKLRGFSSDDFPSPTDYAMSHFLLTGEFLDAPSSAFNNAFKAIENLSNRGGWE